LPDAVAEGSVNMVTFGDSVPVQGDPSMFPDRIVEKLSELVTVNSTNVAIGGTISTDWLPGTSNFEQVLVPHLADADLIVISLGGNDVMGYAANAMSDPAGIAGAVDGLNDFLISVMGNVMAIVAEIRVHNPDVDIVYCLYPNYAKSDMWSSVVPAMFQTLVTDLVTTGLDLVRESIPSEEDVVLMDLYGATADVDLDLYLFDQLHFNDAGQDLYADEILKVLGFVHVEGGTTVSAPAFGMTP
jgi:lysophospholipase L1-like esterase